MNDFLPMAAMLSLVIAVINFLKYIRAKDTNGWVTQLIVWVAGVAVVLLTAQTDFADGIPVGDQNLAVLNAWSLILVGLSIASAGSFAVEIKKAIDNGDSAVKPNLVNPQPPPGG
jgi:hypothetical protein